MKIELSEIKNQLREERSSLRRNKDSGTKEFEENEGDQQSRLSREEGDGQASEAEAAAAGEEKWGEI